MTLTVRHDDAGVTLRGPVPADADFTLSSAPRENIVTPGSTVQTQDDDRVLLEHTAAVIDHEHELTIDGATPGVFDGGVTVESLDPGVATVDAQSLRATRVADGTARFRVTAQPLRAPTLRKGISLAFSRSSGTSYEFVEHAAGSAARAADDAIDNLLAAGGEKAIYTTQNHTGGVYVRNGNCWAASLHSRLTCCSPWNSEGAHRQAQTLVTPRHIIAANHGGYYLNTSATVRFVAENNTVHTRTVSNHMQVAGSDLHVHVLDSDLPATVRPCKVLPANFADYLPTGGDIAALFLDQEEKALVGEVYKWGATKTTVQAPSDATRAAYYELPVVGDSGNPAFVVIGGELVMLLAWMTPWTGYAPHGFITQINAAFATMGDDGGYTLDEIDLSGYTDFS